MCRTFSELRVGGLDFTGFRLSVSELTGRIGGGGSTDASRRVTAWEQH